MAKISISFRIFSNSKKTKQTLKLCAKLEGSTQYAPRVVSNFGRGGLKDPDFKRWDAKKQRFSKRAANAEENNAVLDAVEKMCREILDECEPSTIEELWELVDEAKSGKPVKKKDKTLGWFLNSLIEEMKGGLSNRLPSANFQTYVRLLHHLEREDKRPKSKHILRTPVGSLSDSEFKAFGEYIRSLRKPNYLDLMKYFKRAHNVALRRGLASQPLSYAYSDDAPAKTFDQLMAETKGVASLTVEQMRRLEEFDVSQLSLPCRNADFYKRLYLDTCLLMFYLYSRPIDIFNMKASNIRKCDRGFYVEYLPIKKKNSSNVQKAFVRCPIGEKAMAIIKRYMGMSPAGYILPYSENKKAWNLSDPAQYHTRFNRTNCMLGKVNSFLKKIGEALGISFDNDTFTMYVFRHSAITQAIFERNIPPMAVAKMAGTSVKEIERSYVDHTASMFDYA